MFFFPGSKVYLKFEETWAVVQQMDEDGFLEVSYASGSSSWVHKDDALSEEEYLYELSEQSKESTAILSGSSVAKEELLPWTLPKDGFYLCLISSAEQLIADEYQIWLVNSTAFECDFEATLENSESTLHTENGILEVNQPYMLCELFIEDLSMQSRLNLHLSFKSDQGKLTKTLLYKFQPQKLVKVPMDRQRDLRHQWIALLTSDQFIEREKLTISTRIKKSSPRERTYLPVDLHDISKKAAFPLEIDLHANKLFKTPPPGNPSEIVKHQMQAFHRYIQEAIQLGIDRVYIIHGIGEGKLKERIHQELDRMNYIQSFKNEYHPKYGWGATEVIIS